MLAFWVIIPILRRSLGLVKPSFLWGWNETPVICLIYLISLCCMSQKQKCRGPEPNTRFGQFSSHRGQTMESLPPLRWILEEKQQVLDSCFSKCGLDCKPRAPDGSWEPSEMQFRASSRLAEFGSASEAGPQEFVSVRAAPLCSSAAFFPSDQPGKASSGPLCIQAWRWWAMDRSIHRWGQMVTVMKRRERSPGLGLGDGLSVPFLWHTTVVSHWGRPGLHAYSQGLGLFCFLISHFNFNHNL